MRRIPDCSAISVGFVRRESGLLDPPSGPPAPPHDVVNLCRPSIVPADREIFAIEGRGVVGDATSLRLLATR
jgi:hypothetical protein